MFLRVAYAIGDDRDELSVRRNCGATEDRVIGKLLGCAALERDFFKLCIGVLEEHRFGIGGADRHKVELPIAELFPVGAIRIGAKNMGLDFGGRSGHEDEVSVGAGSREARISHLKHRGLGAGVRIQQEDASCGDREQELVIAGPANRVAGQAFLREAPWPVRRWRRRP